MKTPSEIYSASERINAALQNYSNKDWNYSRIRLQARSLEIVTSPYVLSVEWLNARDKTGQSELTRLRAEVAWGCRHSDELSILEIISLRLNKALLESTSDTFWEQKRPIIRIVSRQALESQDVAECLWYEVEEVEGADFENR